MAPGSNIHRLKQEYTAAAQTARDVRRRAARARPRLRAGEWRMLFAVIDKTALWSCQQDEATLAELAALADLSTRHARRALRSLADRELIQYRPGTGRSKSVIGLSREDTLVLSGGTHTSSQGGPSGGTPGVTDGGQPRGDDRGSPQVLGNAFRERSTGTRSKALSATRTTKPKAAAKRTSEIRRRVLGARPPTAKPSTRTPTTNALDKHLRVDKPKRARRK